MILLVIIDFFMMKTTKSIMLVRYCNLKDFFYEKKVEQYSFILFKIYTDWDLAK